MKEIALLAELNIGKELRSRKLEGMQTVLNERIVLSYMK